eukprot:scaffold1802_cov383-Prasinococcus_capsulatus_cf.AAC.1
MGSTTLCVSPARRRSFRNPCGERVLPVMRSLIGAQTERRCGSWGPASAVLYAVSDRVREAINHRRGLEVQGVESLVRTLGACLHVYACTPRRPYRVQRAGVRSSPFPAGRADAARRVRSLGGAQQPCTCVGVLVCARVIARRCEGILVYSAQRGIPGRSTPTYALLAWPTPPMSSRPAPAFNMGYHESSQAARTAASPKGEVRDACAQDHELPTNLFPAVEGLPVAACHSEGLRLGGGTAEENALVGSRQADPRGQCWRATPRTKLSLPDSVTSAPLDSRARRRGLRLLEATGKAHACDTRHLLHATQSGREPNEYRMPAWQQPQQQQGFPSLSASAADLAARQEPTDAKGLSADEDHEDDPADEDWRPRPEEGGRSGSRHACATPRRPQRSAAAVPARRGLWTAARKAQLEELLRRSEYTMSSKQLGAALGISHSSVSEQLRRPEMKTHYLAWRAAKT